MVAILEQRREGGVLGSPKAVTARLFVQGGALQLIASIQLHTPSFLAGCAWTTYGPCRARRTSNSIARLARPPNPPIGDGVSCKT